MVTDEEFYAASKIVNKYINQKKEEIAKILNIQGISKTPKELHFYWDTYFPTMNIRLWNLLRFNFNNKKLCDITKKEFLSVKGA